MTKITIRDFKKATVQAAIATSAATGAVALMLGSTSCFVGLTGAATIKLSELLNPHRRALKTMMFYGSAGVGAGLFSIGVGVAIADTIGEKILVEELDLELGNTISNLDFEKPSACVGCKNYHGFIYNGVRLVCGIHPYGQTDKCPDWLEHAEKN